MPKILITPVAKQDLIEIWLYIAEHNVPAADGFLDTIDQKFRMISHTPQMGRARHELSPHLRSYPAGNNIIFYRPMENGIQVIRVLSSSRDINLQFPDTGNPE